MMDCDTTGIEPDLALTKAKKLVGGGTMLIVNQTIPRALRNLDYSDEQVEAIVDFINEHKTVIGAPGFNPEHLPVFACSMGDNPIHYMGHVTMMGAVQPFLSGAISKTVNLPEEATVEELEQLHIESWRLGLKSVAVYRDNCKVGQPLSTQKKAGASTPQPEHGGEIVESTPERIVERVVEHLIVQEPVRQKLPRVRASKTFSFRVADCHGYVTVGEFEDGRPGELFLRVAKQGSTLAGIMDAFAISVSHGLQYGVPIEAFCEMFTNMRFEPAGMTDDPDIRFASSLVDYIFRRLAVEYIAEDKRRDMGILTVGERLQPTLPGVEEAAAAAEPVMELLPPEDRAPGGRPVRHRPGHAAARRPRCSSPASARPCSATSAATSCSAPAPATPARPAARRAAARNVSRSRAARRHRHTFHDGSLRTADTSRDLPMVFEAAGPALRIDELGSARTVVELWCIEAPRQRVVGDGQRRGRRREALHPRAGTTPARGALRERGGRRPAVAPLQQPHSPGGADATDEDSLRAGHSGDA